MYLYIMQYISKLNTIQDQLNNALEELKTTDKVNNELVYDYVFVANRLINDLKVELN